MHNRTTSYSEVNDFLKCQQLWFNKYVRKIRRNGFLNYRLAYGIAGHKWLEVYYRSLMEMGTTNQAPSDIKFKAISKANEVFLEYQRNERIEPWIIADLIDILSRYVFQPQPYRFEILAVEKKFGDVMSPHEYNNDDPENAYVVTVVDLLFRALDGKFAGELGIWDTKFSENFPHEDAVKMNAQIPKQIHTLRENGYPVTFGALNYLRFRKMDRKKNQLFKRAYVPVDDARIDATMKEHYKASRLILYLKNIKPEIAADTVIKIQQPHICKDCEMVQICMDELSGRSPENTIKAFYSQRDGGYDG